MKQMIHTVPYTKDNKLRPTHNCDCKLEQVGNNWYCACLNIK